eukprot:2087830-Pyramimonas_sp.AAC.1
MAASSHSAGLFQVETHTATIRQALECLPRMLELDTRAPFPPPLRELEFPIPLVGLCLFPTGRSSTGRFLGNRV